MAPTFVQLVLSTFLAAALVKAESHTISFTNNCGKGTPTLIVGGEVVSNGTAYTKNGVINGISYLQTGECEFNGEECALMEFNLANPVVAGGGSSTDISLIDPHKLNVPVGFNYYNGCDGVGSSCLTGNCHTAFFKPDDNQVQVACQTNNVNLMITYCPSGSSSSSSSDDSSSSTSAAAESATSTKKAATTSTAAEAANTSAASAEESATTSVVKHVAAATSAESTATASASASTASSAPTTRASSKTCKSKAAAKKRSSNQSPAKRASSWHHRSRNSRAAF